MSRSMYDTVRTSHNYATEQVFQLISAECHTASVESVHARSD